MEDKVYSFFGKKLYVLHDYEDIKTVLNSNCKLSFFNKNFNAISGLKYSISNYDTDSDIWKSLHRGLALTLNKNWDKLYQIMDKHQHILTSNYEFNLEDKLDEFLLSVWAEFTLGTTDVNAYRRVRSIYNSYLKDNFHKSYLHMIPFLSFKNDGSAINIQYELLKLMGTDSIFYDLRFVNLNKYDNCNDILLDNMQLSLLVYDFIYEIALEYMKTKDRYAAVEKRFFFPYRLREINDPIYLNKHNLKKGDLCLVYIKQKGLYFSHGPRRCVGYATFFKILDYLDHIFENKYLEITDHDEGYIINNNFPLNNGKTQVMLTYPRNYLTNTFYHSKYSMNNTQILLK